MLLASHLVAAGAALIIGLIAMFARKRQGLHTLAGRAYFLVVSLVSVTGAALSILDWEGSGIFLAIAVSTQAFAILGFVAGGRPERKWLMTHALGMLGSYVQIVGAFVVNNWFLLTGSHGRYSPAAFLLPGAVGTLAITWLLIQIKRGHRPRL